MEPIYVFAVVGALIFLLLLVGAPMKPIRFIGQGLVKILVGSLFLFFLNTFGTAFGIHVPINLVTASISGFLGIPGLAALTAIQQLIINV